MRRAATLLKIEEGAMLLAACAGIWAFEAEWWWWFLLLLGPDISMLGYLIGNKAGAFCYNLFHLKAIAFILFIFGFVYSLEDMMLAGFVVFGHSSLDRMFGYGLKLDAGFAFTHLGKIGKAAKASQP